jgi:plastocyanin
VKTSSVVLLGLGVATAVLLVAGATYMISRQVAPQQATYPGATGPYGYPRGMMGSLPSYPGGMMGGYGSFGGYGGYGGMMGGRGMMGGYGGMMGQYRGYAGTYPQYAWNRTSLGPVVAVVNYRFYPSTVTVSKGTTVTWVNMDFVQHTVTAGSEQAPTGLFDSHELYHMQSFSYTFDTPGTYNYYCDVHPYMVGTVVVTG